MKNKHRIVQLSDDEELKEGITLTQSKLAHYSGKDESLKRVI